MIKASEMLKALLTIKEQAISGTIFDERFGICNNLQNVSSRSGFIFDCTYKINRPFCYVFVERYSIGWSEHTSSNCYPIPLDGIMYGLWVGRQLEYRISLLNYLIKQMEGLGDTELVL